MIRAIRSIDLPVAFSMASDITSSVFAQISPYQNEVVIQPRGIRISVVDSMQSVCDFSFEIKQSLACLVREERIVLLWANSVDAAIIHGSDAEHMFMESVR